MTNIAIFASGSGSNAQRIVEYFENKDFVDIKLILSNRKDAFVLQRAHNLKIRSLVFTRTDFYNTDLILQTLLNEQIDLIILAGFLWLVPQNLLQHFPNKIINIHPALLPKYGGKGMYGHFVHEAVIANREKESGITIHYVNSNYDEGNIIAQYSCKIDEMDTPESLAGKIHELEYAYFPVEIEKLIKH